MRGEREAFKKQILRPVGPQNDTLFVFLAGEFVTLPTSFHGERNEGITLRITLGDGACGRLLRDLRSLAMTLLRYYHSFVEQAWFF